LKGVFATAKKVPGTHENRNGDIRDSEESRRFYFKLITSKNLYNQAKVLSQHSKEILFENINLSLLPLSNGISTKYAEPCLHITCNSKLSRWDINGDLETHDGPKEVIDLTKTVGMDLAFTAYPWRRHAS